jgi:hypothetical protein
MNHTASTRPHQRPRRDRRATPPRDRFADQFNDDDLERALRTVSWNPKDVANFLRTSSAR